MRTSARPSGRAERRCARSGATSPIPTSTGSCSTGTSTEDNTFDLSGSAFTPLANPADPNSAMVETHFENLTSYKNRNGGVWTRGELLMFRNAKLADNAIGMTQFDRRRSAANGLPRGWSIRWSWARPTTSAIPRRRRKSPMAAACRSRQFRISRSAATNTTITAIDVVNTTFVNYQDNAGARQARCPGCCSRAPGSAPKTPSTGRNSSMPSRSISRRSIPGSTTTTGVASAYRTLSIHDLDGSTTGIPNSYILLNDGENDSVVTDDSLPDPSHLERLCVHGRCRTPVSPGGSVAALSHGRAGIGKSADSISRIRRSDAPARPAGASSAPAPPPPQAPIALVRNGKEFHITGNQSTVRAGTEIEVEDRKAESHSQPG